MLIKHQHLYKVTTTNISYFPAHSLLTKPTKKEILKVPKVDKIKQNATSTERIRKTSAQVPLLDS